MIGGCRRKSPGLRRASPPSHSLVYVLYQVWDVMTFLIVAAITVLDCLLPGIGNAAIIYMVGENPMDRGGWWAAVHGVAQSRTQLKRLSMHACIGEGIGNPLQYSCLENPRDRGAWWAAIYGVAESDTTEAT